MSPRFRIRYTGISRATTAIRTADRTANRRGGAARCARDANAAAASALPIDGDTAYRLDRVGTNRVMANIEAHQTRPNRIVRRSSSVSGTALGTRRNISTADTVAHVAPRSRYSVAF